MANDTIMLRPKAPKTILLALVSLVFTAGGILIAQKESLKGWSIAAFFGLGFIVFIIQLIPGSTQLTLTKDGFIMTSLFRSNLTKWTDVKAFKLGYLGRKQAVVFDYSSTHKKHAVGKLIAKKLSNSHGALPSNYGLPHAELLSLLNSWKDKYGAA
jgi:hypothetical protein